MNTNIFWQKREDGVICAEPKEFSTWYYVYPPQYDENTSVDKYELWLINQSEILTQERLGQFDNLEQAKEYAINKFKEIITSYMNLND
ncbi:MAG: hypothetical protein KBD37_00340 [Burkholderiales bacterium]|nr:hypothetical protein [Burkholderiales bacterium]